MVAHGAKARRLSLGGAAAALGCMLPATSSAAPSSPPLTPVRPHPPPADSFILLDAAGYQSPWPQQGLCVHSVCRQRGNGARDAKGERLADAAPGGLLLWAADWAVPPPFVHLPLPPFPLFPLSLFFSDVFVDISCSYPRTARRFHAPSTLVVLAAQS